MNIRRFQNLLLMKSNQAICGQIRARSIRAIGINNFTRKDINNV